MFKIFSLIAAVFANVHTINDKIEVAYGVWKAIYAGFPARVAATQPAPSPAVQQVAQDAAAELSDAEQQALAGIRL